MAVTWRSRGGPHGVHIGPRDGHIGVTLGSAGATWGHAQDTSTAGHAGARAQSGTSVLYWVDV
eukprot:2249225-Prymnesium_polylepis.1